MQQAVREELCHSKKGKRMSLLGTSEKIKGFEPQLGNAKISEHQESCDTA